jgi:hypothetical protein
MNPSTDMLLCVSRVTQAIVRVVSGSERPCLCSQEQGCKLCVNLVQTNMHGLHGDGFHVKICTLGSIWKPQKSL